MQSCWSLPILKPSFTLRLSDIFFSSGSSSVLLIFFPRKALDFLPNRYKANCVLLDQRFSQSPATCGTDLFMSFLIYDDTIRENGRNARNTLCVS